MGVTQAVARAWARWFGGGNVPPKEIVVHLPRGGAQPPEQVAQQLRAAFPMGRTVQGVDLLTGAVEVRIFYDAAVLSLVRRHLQESGAPHDISFLY